MARGACPVWFALSTKCFHTVKPPHHHRCWHNAVIALDKRKQRKGSKTRKLWKTRSQLCLTSKVNPRSVLIIEIKAKKKKKTQQVYSASLRHHPHLKRIMALLCFIFFSLCFLDNGEDLNENCCEGIYWFRSKAQITNGWNDTWFRGSLCDQETDWNKKNGTKSSLSKWCNYNAV